MPNAEQEGDERDDEVEEGLQLAQRLLPLRLCGVQLTHPVQRW